MYGIFLVIMLVVCFIAFRAISYAIDVDNRFNKIEAQLQSQAEKMENAQDAMANSKDVGYLHLEDRMNKLEEKLSNVQGFSTLKKNDL